MIEYKVLFGLVSDCNMVCGGQGGEFIVEQRKVKWNKGVYEGEYCWGKNM